MGARPLTNRTVCFAKEAVTKAVLTLKAPITTRADDIHKYFFIVFFRENKTMFQLNPLLGRVEEDLKMKKENALQEVHHFLGFFLK